MLLVYIYRRTLKLKMSANGDRRRPTVSRTHRGFRSGLEALEDRITPTSVTGLSPSAGPLAGGTSVSVPTVLGLSPTSGPTGGGTLVTITGIGFTDATTVKFGATTLSTFLDEGDTTILAESPPGTGVVDVTVTSPLGGFSTSANQFTYVAPAPPTVVLAINPSTGPTSGGSHVLITGTGLGNVTAVLFGSTPATAFTLESATEVVATSPPGLGTVDVTVTGAGGTSALSHSDVFSYADAGALAPRVMAISPRTGLPSGGTLVTITGLGFDPSARPAPAVYFGKIEATNVSVVNSTTITADSPAGSVGAVDVTVVTPGGVSGTSGADVFTYAQDGPRITSVESYGVCAQPTSLVITLNQVLDAGPADSVSNYRLVGHGRRRIKIKSAQYNAATNTVTLEVAPRLNLRLAYTLTVNGTTASGLTSTTGLLLDGANTGQPGSNYVTSISASNLAGRASRLPIRRR